MVENSEEEAFKTAQRMQEVANFDWIKILRSDEIDGQ